MDNASQFQSVIKRSDFPCPGGFAARIIGAEKKFGGAPVIMGAKPGITLAERVGTGGNTVFGAYGQRGKGIEPGIRVAIGDGADRCQHLVKVSTVRSDVIQGTEGLKMEGLVTEEPGKTVIDRLSGGRAIGDVCHWLQNFLYNNMRVFALFFMW
ncbi:hypothetical protein RI056_17655 [Komagataeibacter nataicola]|uniref:hypothetical protein n=1 Tax=Komagataeibacter nataicola TaxID=265960 RepID=UPI0028AB4506|nr:hypothetical protein [Komagataeibacter nataicola]WNM08616.1 hypothetical protein RI056_17655 [Komagataeibacter nataicola]